MTKVPVCKNVGSRGPLPPLLGELGLSDFPEKGDNLPVSFSNSNFALFPFDVAVEIANAYPKAWCAGGNHFGNYAFAYWAQTTEAIHRGRRVPDECLRWIKKRELYIARHRQDFRLAGVVAMIKWAGFVEGPDGSGDGATTGSSLGYMIQVIEAYGK